MANATMGSPMTRNEALNWCVDRLKRWPASLEPKSPTWTFPAGWEWQHQPPTTPEGRSDWVLCDPSFKHGPITRNDVLNRENYPPEPTAHPVMTRAQALECIAKKLDEWPIFGDTPDSRPMVAEPAKGWVWTLSGSKNWYLKSGTNRRGNRAILKSDWQDARNALDLDALKPASVEICGVSANIGDRVKVKMANVVGGNEFTGTVAGVQYDDVWFVDCSHSRRGVACTTDEIRGFAHVSERDEFIDRATEAMIKGNPAMSSHIAQSCAVSMWDAGARFTDEGGE